MDSELIPESLAGTIQDGLMRLEGMTEFVLTPGWRQYQVFIVLGVIAAAFALRVVTKTFWEHWARRREGWPKWRLRIVVLLLRRLTLVYFVLLIWPVYLAMQQYTWPSRSYWIGVAATLATAWLAIAILARAVQNRTLRVLFSWSGWIYATLAALNLLDDAAEVLDNAAMDIGTVHISLLSVIKAVVLAAVLLTAARLVTQMASSALSRNKDISPSMQVLAGKAVQVLLYGLALMFTVRAFGVDLTGLAFLSGAIGLGIGFGLQKVVSNLVSGVIILMDRSIKPGDVISLGDTFGWINALGARYVSVVTRNGREYLIPNEDFITSQVVNWSHSDRYVRVDISFGTSYEDDPHEVREVAIKAAGAVNRVLQEGPRRPVCHITGFGDSSVDYVLRIWISDPSGGLTNIRGNVFLALWDAFKERGISIPFPQREMRLLNEAVDVRGHANGPDAPGARRAGIEPGPD